MSDSNKTTIRRTNTSRKRGAAAVELAMVAPVVFLLIFCSIEFSRMMMVRQAMTNAAREGCRLATLVTTQNHSAAEQYIRDELQLVIGGCQDENVLRIEFDPEFNGTYLASGTEITADVEVNCDDVSWLPPFLFQGIEIRTTSTMVRE